MTLTHTEILAIQDNAECLHDAVAVHHALDQMAATITDTLGGTLPVVLCVLNGGIIPTGHLLTRLGFPLETGYLHATRYRGKTSGADMHWLCEPSIELQERTVLIIDDILDEGLTLADIVDYCESSGATQVYSAVLVQKQHQRCAPGVSADFVGLQVEDRYVFGFGMDYKGYLRNMNGIYAVREQDSQ
ncbi:MAG: hypoxanthine-guanine phosphoribosyltransferase [Gammaproteobacteria bacterium]